MGETLRTPELIDRICERLSVGDPLRQICRDENVSKSIVYVWIDQDLELAGRIARARAEGYDAIAENCLTIADDCEDDAQSRRVRVDTRLKLLAKWDPKRYGDALTLKGDKENPLHVMSEAALDARLAEYQAKFNPGLLGQHEPDPGKLGQ